MIHRFLTRFNLNRALLFVAVVAVVVYFLPRTDRVQYSYQTGRPWIHPLLTAPFDIPVYRDSVSTRELIDSINETFDPVYKINMAPRDTILARVRGCRSLSFQQRVRLQADIDTLYAHGVADTDNAGRLRETRRMAVINDRLVTIRDASRVRSQRQAYAWIDSVVRDPSSRHALQEMQLSRLLLPNLSLDTVENGRLYNERVQPVTAAISVIQQGERIIDRGDIVTPQLDMILSTYETMAADRYSLTSGQRLYTLLGQVLMGVIIMTLVYLYLYLYRRDIFDNIRSLTALVILFLGFYVLAVVASGATVMGVFLVPFAMIAILIVVFFDSHTALFLYLL